MSRNCADVGFVGEFTSEPLKGTASETICEYGGILIQYSELRSLFRNQGLKVKLAELGPYKQDTPA